MPGPKKADPKILHISIHYFCFSNLSDLQHCMAWCQRQRSCRESRQCSWAEAVTCQTGGEGEENREVKTQLRSRVLKVSTLRMLVQFGRI